MFACDAKHTCSAPIPLTCFRAQPSSAPRWRRSPSSTAILPRLSCLHNTRMSFSLSLHVTFPYLPSPSPPFIPLPARATSASCSTSCLSPLCVVLIRIPFTAVPRPPLPCRAQPPFPTRTFPPLLRSRLSRLRTHANMPSSAPGPAAPAAQPCCVRDPDGARARYVIALSPSSSEASCGPWARMLP
ncbi:hypothetical protein DFH09DRAFT_282465 [Mycena vulgaris]|nr:hypothetical protein DFH09DRAFT_282465 [Mycena vulgaris]